MNIELKEIKISEVANGYFNDNVSGNAIRTHEQLPSHNILPLFQFQ